MRRFSAGKLESAFPTHRDEFRRPAFVIVTASDFAWLTVERKDLAEQNFGMSIDEKVACAVNVIFGAAVGFVVYLFALGGFKFLLMSRPGSWWNGWGAFFLCVAGGGLVGWLGYRNRHKIGRAHV